MFLVVNHGAGVGRGDGNGDNGCGGINHGRELTSMLAVRWYQAWDGHWYWFWWVLVAMRVITLVVVSTKGVGMSFYGRVGCNSGNDFCGINHEN